jgi:hypothetical protein
VDWNDAANSWPARICGRPHAPLKRSNEISRCWRPCPEIGRPHSDLPELRALVVSLGDSGYVALHRHEPADDAVYALAFPHQKEAGY